MVCTVHGMASIYSEEHGSAFLRVFGASPQLRLLDFFMDNPNHDFSRGEVMEAVGMAKRTLYEYLPVLLEGGAVKVSRRIGRAELYTLDRGSPIVQCFMRVEEELTKPSEASTGEAEELIVP